MNNNAVLANCAQCGRVYLGTNSKICSQCQKKNQELLGIIRKHIEKNQTVSLDEIVKSVDLPETAIDWLVKQGRLWYMPQVKLTCRLCQKEIKYASGKLICSKCYSTLAAHQGNQEKIVRLRKNLRTRDQQLREHKEQQQLNQERKYGFKSSFKEQLAKYTTANEAEYYPEPAAKLSNTMILSPVSVYA